MGYVAWACMERKVLTEMMYVHTTGIKPHCITIDLKDMFKIENCGRQYFLLH